MTCSRWLMLMDYATYSCLWQVTRHPRSSGEISLTWNPSSRLLVMNSVKKDHPIKCIHLFHTWVMDLLQKYILYKSNGILSRVQYHVIRYKVQHRLSLHAHIIFWFHPEDLASNLNDILAYVPTIYDDNTMWVFFAHLYDKWWTKIITTGSNTLLIYKI